MPKKKKKATRSKKTTKRPATKKKTAKSGSHIRKSKSDDFLNYIRNNNSMVDYIMALRIMNPAAKLQSDLNEPRREGGFVRLAHAREEFTAPVLSKGKAVESAKKAAKKALSRRK